MLLFKNDINTFFSIVDNFDPASDSINERRESFSSRSSLTSLPSQWSNYGPMDSFIARSLSSSDKAKFHMHLLQVTIYFLWILTILGQ